MRRHVVACGCLLALALALLAGCRSGTGRTGSLAGTVQEAATNAPIGDAEVTVGAATARTDARGSFTIDELEVGDRSATVTAPGYHTLTKTIPIEAGDNTVVFELRPVGDVDGGAMDGPVGDAPLQYDAAPARRRPERRRRLHRATTARRVRERRVLLPGPVLRQLLRRLLTRLPGDLRLHQRALRLRQRLLQRPHLLLRVLRRGDLRRQHLLLRVLHGGGCCAEAQYCIDSSAYSYSQCRATCGNLTSAARYNNDCCQQQLRLRVLRRRELRRHVVHLRLYRLQPVLRVRPVLHQLQRLQLLRLPVDLRGHQRAVLLERRLLPHHPLLLVRLLRSVVRRRRDRVHGGLLGRRRLLLDRALLPRLLQRGHDDLSGTCGSGVPALHHGQRLQQR